MDKSHNSPHGIVLIEWCGDEGKAHEMTAKLNAIAGVEAKEMVFGH